MHRLMIKTVWATYLMSTMLLSNMSFAASAENSPPLASQALAAPCTSCHGLEGSTPTAIPSLYGKKADYLAEALQGFKTGQRESTLMNRIAKGYNDEQIKTLANYFEQKTPAKKSGGK